MDMKRFTLAVMLVGGLAATPALAQDDGQTAFNNSCRTCHTMKEGDNRQGPSLAGIVGRKAGSLPGFNYSPSMKQSGITWDEATLDKFIADPEQVVHGSTMKPYGGITDAAQRKTIVDFLKSGG
jgi:cytochrome c